MCSSPLPCEGGFCAARHATACRCPCPAPSRGPQASSNPSGARLPWASLPLAPLPFSQGPSASLPFLLSPCHSPPFDVSYPHHILPRLHVQPPRSDGY